MNIALTTNVLTPTPITVLEKTEVNEAWQWWITNIHPRPVITPPSQYIFDNKQWRPADSCLLKDDTIHIDMLAKLYLTSQLTGDVTELLPVLEGNANGVYIFTPKLEDTIARVIRTEDRFRDALSEHLAFWAQLAELQQSGIWSRFTITSPNFIPEDSGPDGLALAFDNNQNTSIEIRSVKNSINNPRPLIATPEFRAGTKTTPDSKKQLEEFYLIATLGFAFCRLDRLLSQAWHTIQDQGITQNLRAGLLQNQRKFNAVVVADSRHANTSLFEGYHHVPCPSDEHRIATYISSDDWTVLANRVQNKVTTILGNCGAM